MNTRLAKPNGQTIALRLRDGPEGGLERIALTCSVSRRFCYR